MNEQTWGDQSRKRELTHTMRDASTIFNQSNTRLFLTVAAKQQYLLPRPEDGAAGLSLMVSV
jgi:hypothetical protein